MNLTQYDQLSELNALFGSTQQPDKLLWLGLDVIILIVMTSLLGWVYVRSAYSLSNRNRLAVLFPVLALTTMMVISFIQSSLALSLGLVGALSIVRFRSAIKEPEELVYIFLVIALGLGFGSQQQVLTMVFFSIIFVVLVGKLVLRHRLKFLSPAHHVLHYLDISLKKPGRNQDPLTVEKVSSIVTPLCHQVAIKRVDHSDETTQLLFELQVSKPSQLEQLLAQLATAYPKAEISVTQHESLFA